MIAGADELQKAEEKMGGIPLSVFYTSNQVGSIPKNLVQQKEELEDFGREFFRLILCLTQQNKISRLPLMCYTVDPSRSCCCCEEAVKL